MRFFPKAWAKLRAYLTPAEIIGYQDVLMQYMQSDGDFRADDKRLAVISGMSLKSWVTLREKLEAHGIATMVDGRWVDFDQQENLRRQIETSRKQSDKAHRKHALQREQDDV